LEELTFDEELGLVLVGLCSQVDRRGRVTFSNVLDEDVKARG